MAINANKVDKLTYSMVQLIDENEVKSLFGEASASIAANPTVAWAKFVLTDDRANGNGQRIPAEEFQNLINTGINMPIKMALGEIAPGHDDSKPLGVITYLKEIMTELGHKALIALAALWEAERPADVKYIRERIKENLPVDVSWEILYEDSVFNEEHSSMDLLSTILRAATIVGNPAYQGRTQFLSVAAKKWSKAYMDTLPEKCFLYVDEDGNKHLPIADSEGKLDMVKMKEALKSLDGLPAPANIIEEKKGILGGILQRCEAGANLEELSNEFFSRPSQNLEENTLDALEELQTKLSEKETALANLQTELDSLKQELSVKDTELTELRQFKADLDAEIAKQEKLEGIKAKFSEAGISKDEEYFVTNEETLLKLDELTLDFMLTQMKPASEPAESSEAQASTEENKIPVILGEGHEEITISDMASYLRTRRNK